VFHQAVEAGVGVGFEVGAGMAVVRSLGEVVGGEVRSRGEVVDAVAVLVAIVGVLDAGFGLRLMGFDGDELRIRRKCREWEMMRTKDIYLPTPTVKVCAGQTAC